MTPAVASDAEALAVPSSPVVMQIVQVTPTSETRLEGTAHTTIRYADYGITIPQVRQVASVDEDVRLDIDFVATTT